jgi:signal transduction histidine kinase/ActR/RegA family two-component response regulator
VETTETRQTVVAIQTESGHFKVRTGRGRVGVDTLHFLTSESRERARSRLKEIKLGAADAATEGLLCGSGDAFNRWLVTYIQQAVGTPYAFLGEVWGADRNRVRVVAVCHNGEIVPNFDYDLNGTPCKDVLHQEMCAYPSEVAAHYPDDELLAMMGIDAYVGMALPSHAGEPLGLLVVLDTESISEEVIERAVATLDLFRERAGSELRFRAALWDMEMAVAGTSGATLDLLVEGMAKALHVQVAFASGLGATSIFTASSPMLSVWNETGLMEMSGRSAEGTAAAWVREHGELLVLSGAGERFPMDPLLRSTQTEAYCGVAVYDRRHRPVGVVGIVHDRPISEDLIKSPVFQLFRSRIAAELLRQEAESEQQKLQRRLAHSQRQESLGVMAGGIAHDFNNLLMGILATADFLAEDAEGELREDLETIISASKRASSLCGQLLVYAGKGSHSSTKVELTHLLEDSRSLISVLVPPTAHLSTCFGDEKIWTDADPVQIQQILINLAKNAAEALVGSGHVEISLSNVKCERRTFSEALVGSDLEPGNYCRITVADNGEGMDRETISKVCEPFFSTKSNGHGLGLAAVLGIVERHGGALSVESELGVGSRFHVYLPRVQAGEVEMVVPVGRSRSEIEGIYNVLVIDDQASVREAVSRMLQAFGIVTFLADGGREGVRIYKERWQSIDCVIADLSMPDLGGAEVLAMIRTINPTARVVVASGFTEQDVLIGLSNTPSAILAKPFTMRRLEEVLVRVSGEETVDTRANTLLG